MLFMSSYVSAVRRVMPWLLAAAGAVGASAAHAGGVHWSIGIHVAPPVVYGPPAEVVYVPPPAVIYRPAPVRMYRQPPVAYYYEEPRGEWCPPRGYRGGHHHGRWEGERQARWERGYHGGRY